jgi:hypothetical protein
LLHAPCAADARNICIGFADVTRIRRESGVHVTQMFRAKFAYDVRHEARVHHANAARNKGCYFWTHLYMAEFIKDV